MELKQDKCGQSGEYEMTFIDSVHQGYWRANIVVVSSLLLVWFLVSFVFGILFSEELNEIKFFGFKLGFWWAHQGSIFIFVLLIYAYSTIMGRVDRHFQAMLEEGVGN